MSSGLLIGLVAYSDRQSFACCGTLMRWPVPVNSHYFLVISEALWFDDVGDWSTCHSERQCDSHRWFGGVCSIVGASTQRASITVRFITCFWLSSGCRCPFKTIKLKDFKVPPMLLTCRLQSLNGTIVNYSRLFGSFLFVQRFAQQLISYYLARHCWRFSALRIHVFHRSVLASRLALTG